MEGLAIKVSEKKKEEKKTGIPRRVAPRRFREP